MCHTIHALLTSGDAPESVCAIAASGAVMGESNAEHSLSTDATTPLNVSSTYASPLGLATCRKYHLCMARLGTSLTLTRTRPRQPRGRFFLAARIRKLTSAMSELRVSLCGLITSSHASTLPPSSEPNASMTSRTGSMAAPRSTSSMASGPSARTRTRSSDDGSVTPKLRCSCGVATFSARPSHRSCTLTSAPSRLLSTSRSSTSSTLWSAASFLLEVPVHPNQELAMSFGGASPTTSSTLTSNSPSAGSTQ